MSSLERILSFPDTDANPIETHPVDFSVADNTVDKGIDNVLDNSNNILYDIKHILDDVYSYGRILIENNYFNFASNADFNLVYPNIYIGNYSTSTNLELLKSVGITHIISVIPTFNPPYLDTFKYLHIPAYDDETQDLTPFFTTTNTFINNVLIEGNGKILIHCMVGRSRSVSIFLAFLINILHGNFEQSNVQLNTLNDVSNETEHKYIYQAKTNLQTKSDISPDILDDKISKNDYIKPELNNAKYQSFMQYKKESMLDEITNLIEKIKTKKHNSSDILEDLLNYTKKYRPQTAPNPYFLEQLTNLI